jgi:predicted phosphodiesterase
VPELKKLACGLTIFNPGSVALPKGGSSRSFGYFDGATLKHYTI